MKNSAKLIDLFKSRHSHQIQGLKNGLDKPFLRLIFCLKILWSLKEECPDTRSACRGTRLSTGYEKDVTAKTKFELEPSQMLFAFFI